MFEVEKRSLVILILEERSRLETKAEARKATSDPKKKIAK